MLAGGQSSLTTCVWNKNTRGSLFFVITLPMRGAEERGLWLFVARVRIPLHCGRARDTSGVALPGSMWRPHASANLPTARTQAGRDRQTGPQQYNYPNRTHLEELSVKMI